MARTIKNISDSIKIKFIQSQALRISFGIENDYNNSTDSDLTFFNSHFAEVTVVAVLINIVANLIANLENIFDFFRTDIQKIIDSERFGHLGWYENLAKKFQHGDGISNDYSENSDFAETDIYSIIDETKQVVKYCYAQENSTQNGVEIKIATKDINGNFVKLTDEQNAAFTNYMNRIKPAGIPLHIINLSADILTLKLIIYYDQLILTNNGATIIDNVFVVNNAISAYLNSIDFNGEFVRMKLIDKIQQVAGVEIAEIILSSGTSAANTEQFFDVKYSPRSGYMKLDFDNDLQINYIPKNV
jgi:hypothetical protein